MPKQIASTALPIALVVGLALIILAVGPAPAAADCTAAPGAQAPQGSHWYYRTDRATGRKCWYVSQEGRKGHGQLAPNLIARAQTTEESFASSTSETVDAPLTASTQMEQPTTATWPITAAGDMMQAAAPSPRPASVSEPSQAVRVPAEQEHATTDARVASEQHDAPAQQPVAATPEMAGLVAITPVSLLLLVVGALAIAGIFLHGIFAVAPVRRPPLRQLQDDLAVVIAAARRAAPPLPPPYSPRDYAGAHARSDEEPNPGPAKPHHLLEDVEEALVGVLRHWEHPTASVN
jgi:hypothetical protein